MKVGLSPERARFVGRCLDERRFATPEAVIEAALRLLEAHTADGALRRAVARGFEQVASGRFVAVTADDVKRKARRRPE